MSDTPQQQRNAARIRRALRNFQCYVASGGEWRPVEPLIYYANRRTRMIATARVCIRPKPRRVRECSQ